MTSADHETVAQSVLTGDLQKPSLFQVFLETARKQRDMKVVGYFAMNFLYTMSSQYEKHKDPEALIQAAVCCYTALQVSQSCILHI